MADWDVTLGSWVKRRRKALGLTQQELARRLPCSVVTIQKIEADRRRPSEEFAARLAECLDVPLAQRAAWVHFARAPAGSAQQRIWSQTFRPVTNLPLPATRLLGRERELAAVRQRLIAKTPVCSPSWDRQASARPNWPCMPPQTYRTNLKMACVLWTCRPSATRSWSLR